MHWHVRHLKAFIHTIIKGRNQTRVREFSLAGITMIMIFLPPETLCYLHSGSGESVQFLRVYLPRWDAVKETRQRDQPHCSDSASDRGTQTSRLVSGTEACECLEAGLRASWVWIWGEASEPERWCTRMSRPDLLPRQMLLSERRGEAAHWCICRRQLLLRLIQQIWKAIVGLRSTEDCCIS